MNHLPHQPHDILRVVGAVGVTADAAVLVFGQLVLVDQLFHQIEPQGGDLTESTEHLNSS
jgi:hypothetical protein